MDNIQCEVLFISGVLGSKVMIHYIKKSVIRAAWIHGHV